MQLHLKANMILWIVEGLTGHDQDLCIIIAKQENRQKEYYQ